jgi:CHAD domain-containing protein
MAPRSRDAALIPSTRIPSTLTNGAFAQQLIDRSTRRLVGLQAEVLDDHDPEPLHQMRVAMRRLRTALRQFGPALLLPEEVHEQAIARVARRLGRARDLDVLGQRLDERLLPQLPEAEQRALRPVRRQLRRERQLAGEQLAEVLRGGRYLKLLAQLQRWQKQPHFTPLGALPLRDWLVEWQTPELAAILAHPGWFVADLEGDLTQVHALRKQCKHARYALEPLQPFTGRHCSTWAERFRHWQDLLGELNDLEVLRQAIETQRGQPLEQGLPQLQALLQASGAQLWQQWRGEAQAQLAPRRRRRLFQDLLIESGPPGGAWWGWLPWGWFSQILTRS